MVSVNFQNDVKTYQAGGPERIKVATLPIEQKEALKPAMSTPSFKATAYSSVLTVRTQLNGLF